MKPVARMIGGRRTRWAVALGGALLALSLLLGATLTNGIADESPAMVQQGPKLTGGGEEIGSGRVGRSVALSADGNTALVGAPHDDGEIGAAWVFVRSGSTWTEQAKLTGVGELGEGHFGRGVALSADGDTALVGAPNDSAGTGAVWMFVRSGSTWTEQAKLTGAEESGKGWFGRSVALSADGDTALVGGFVDHSDLGAAWAFARAGSAWTQQGKKLTAAEESGEGEFGWSVALSADGDTALIGGEGDGGVGAAWAFTRAGSAWAQQGKKLTGAGELGAGFFGADLALSADGDTALIGGFKDDTGAGAAWVFARAGSAWAQRGAKLTGGAQESGEGQFGWSVALSADGSTALVGGLADGGHAGAAWVFVDPPPSAPEPPATPATPSGAEMPSTTPAQSTAATPNAPTTPAKGRVAAKGGVAAYRCARSRGRKLRAHSPCHAVCSRGRSPKNHAGRRSRARASATSRRSRRAGRRRRRCTRCAPRRTGAPCSTSRFRVRAG